MEQLRLIANPHLLANEQYTNHEISKTFHEKLHDVIISEYNEIYIPMILTNKIKQYIDLEINNMMTHRIIEDCIERCIQEVIRQNKFDFIIPFD
tara:strand:- start:905 stop:1186 length:282 start_codon:yes stop_codon:yes gene_type:complete